LIGASGKNCDERNKDAEVGRALTVEERQGMV
jgi:hypothetical protein